jgi:simple sugar transport system substrate-binding protein
VKTAVDAGIPVITLNSGVDSYQDLGAITHVGQSEEIAGEGAGARFKESGATKLLCIIHEQGNLGLNQRCDGAKKGFGGEVENLQVKGTADISTTLTEIQSKLQSDKSIDAVLALNPDIAVAARDAVKGAGSEAKLATFDLSGDVVTAIQDGEIEFAVDQQQYLQGYLPVVFLALNKRNLNTVGGGQPVLTGPGYVTKDNAATVAKLAEDGTR